ncbi:metallophosphoesterase [bacterium]|nr:metallophosphoesterase [bacterium]
MKRVSSRRVHIEEDHSRGEPGAIEHRGGVLEALLARSPTVRRFEVVSSRVDAAHDGITIAHVTDLHVGKGERTTRRVRKAVEILNRLKPDLVCLTGDYVRYSHRALPLLAEALRGFCCPVFATRGNHDHWLDAEGVVAALHLAGIDVLTNEHRTIDLRGSPFHVIGIDDRLTRHDDPELAFSRVPDGGTRLVLSHIAEVADEIGSRGGALVLSGHTHGGQVNVPGITSRIFRNMGRHYMSGFYRVGGQVLYVNKGLGHSVPIRIAAPTEVAVFVLRAAPPVNAIAV